ncbi:MAG: indole-3-glycerol phosphate synthase TrpC [Dermabacter sp.]|nr:indole-3-glycerol phosphate synthase TrpC [Dermabacter sp.]
MTVLTSIIAGVREDLAARVRVVPAAQIRRDAEAAAPPIDVVPLIRASSGIGLIAEVKRSSPSKGALAPITDPSALAADYSAGGANAISVLTEQRRFRGTLADLDAVRSRVSTPVLRKDFMVDEYQFYEARAHGADIVLLIVAALSDAQLAEFYALTRALGMRALVETHDAGEVERALRLDAELIGVNARNLKTLEVDRDHAAALVGTIPSERLAVAESAVVDLADVEAYAAAGADAVLVGEALVTHSNPRDAARAFTQVSRRGRA